MYFREGSRKIRKKTKKRRVQVRNFRINKRIDIPSVKKCPKCKSKVLHYHSRKYKTVFDLKIFAYGVKRWIIRYSTTRVKCTRCNCTLYPNSFTDIPGKYGRELKIWIIYQITALRQSYSRIQESLRVFFNYDLDQRIAYDAKGEMAKYYNSTYEQILSNLQKGRLIHADETSVSIKGINSYVWVFTSLEEVLYVFSPTREGNILGEILKGFNGVLVSDYYFAYDSIECAQQKCLIHLIRDMNDDLLKSPFDEQYKIFMKDFSVLLKSIVETIDKYGLKKYHLSNSIFKFLHR
ncbi:MAG: transposase [Acidobacteriota bacterium]